MARRTVLALVALVLAAGACGDDGPEQPRAEGTSTASTETTVAATDEPTTTRRDYTATTGPDCTRGTIPEGTPVPPGCDRLYSPFMARGGECTEGQAPDCVDPDGDGRFTFIDGGGQCLVERKEPDRCRDDDGDGILDDPLPG